MALSPIGGVPVSSLYCSTSSQRFPSNSTYSTFRLSSGISFGNSATNEAGSSQNTDPWSTITQMVSQVFLSATMGFGFLLGLAGFASFFNKKIVRSSPKIENTNDKKWFDRSSASALV